MKQQATKQQIEAARVEVELKKRIFDAQDKNWQFEWSEKKNPFEAVSWYLSAAQRKIRKPFIDAWLKASARYELIKPKKVPNEV